MLWVMWATCTVNSLLSYPNMLLNGSQRDHKAIQHMQCSNYRRQRACMHVWQESVEGWRCLLHTLDTTEFYYVFGILMQ